MAITIGIPFGVGATAIAFMGEFTAPAAIALVLLGAIAVVLVQWVTRDN